MKILLMYYTGTYNTRYVSSLIKDRFKELGHEVRLYEVNPSNYETLSIKEYDLIGLGYPIYGFNVPYPFMKFIKKQKFNKNQRVFIYKNSGETYSANDASSGPLVRKIRKDKAIISNEYHFLMPYNIHFRFEEPLVKEILNIDRLLLDILIKEILEGIPNIKKYKFIHRLITFFVKIQYIGGPVNSFFYKIDKNKCLRCNVCIKNCPTHNIYINKKNDIKFHHNCLMCMRCSLYCPTDAFKIGFLNSWRVNKGYDFDKISKIELEKDIITDSTKGFFKCYIKTYKDIKNRHQELFNN